MERAPKNSKPCASLTRLFSSVASKKKNDRKYDHVARYQKHEQPTFLHGNLTLSAPLARAGSATAGERQVGIVA
jgi:hypothetical protein